VFVGVVMMSFELRNSSSSLRVLRSERMSVWEDGLMDIFGEGKRE